jgi:hypothetical protein
MSDLLQHDEPALRARAKETQGKARQKPMVMVADASWVSCCVRRLCSSYGDESRTTMNEGDEEEEDEEEEGVTESGWRRRGRRRRRSSGRNWSGLMK